MQLMTNTGKRSTVECLPVAAGLVVHAAPEKGYLVLTHRASGLRAANPFPEDMYDQIADKLRVLDWTGSKVDIIHSDEHKKVVTEVNRLISTRDRSQAQEDRIAKDIGGKRNYGSGAVWGFKRDVVNSELMIEAKTTETDSHSVRVADLEHLYKEASLQGKTPAFAIEFGVGEVVLLPREVFEDSFFDEKEVKDLGKKSRYFKIKESMAELVVPDTRVVAVSTPSREWVLVSYYSFLCLFKAKDEL